MAASDRAPDPGGCSRSWSEFAKKARIDLKKPFEDLPRKTRDLLLERRQRLPGHPGHSRRGL
jgi:hypothetical protein